MCKESYSSVQEQNGPSQGRREFLKAGAVLAAAPLMAAVASNASGTPSEKLAGNGPYTARAFGVTDAKASFAPMQIQRRALRPNDVLLDVMYCSICHTDIHYARNEWGGTPYPCVPGHEIIGRVAAIGGSVTKFKVGEIGGVGCMVDSCGTCENCVADLEQFCLNKPTWTYNSPDPVSGGHTFGGYSDRIVVPQHFVIRIPPGADLAATAPLLCAGVTTFSPMQHWKVSKGQRVGVIGLGGLGHMAVKLAVSRKADVTVFTTSPGKIEDARRMGAREVVLWGGSGPMKPPADLLDIIVSTVPTGFAMQPFVELLKLDGTFVNVGVLLEMGPMMGRALISRRRSLAGSVIGGIAETQEVIDYCSARNIKADIERIRPDQIDRAYDRVVKKDVRYRFVIDMSSTKTAGGAAG